MKLLGWQGLWMAAAVLLGVGGTAAQLVRNQTVLALLDQPLLQIEGLAVLDAPRLAEFAATH